MKRNLALLFALFLLLLTACGKAPQQTEEPEALQPTVQTEAPAGTDAPVRTEEAVTPEEQLARTGVPLTLPPEAEEPAWYVLSFAEGGRIAEARFTAEGVPYILRGEKARQDAPYNFSDLTEPQDGWSWTGFGTVGDVENCSAGSPAGTWYAWLDGDRAFAYVLYTEAGDMENIEFLAEHILFPEIAEEDEAEEQAAEPTAADLIPASVWRYDDSGERIHVMGNRTYRRYASDGSTDGKVYFWEKQKDSDSTLVLLDGKDKKALTLTAYGAWPDCFLKDGEGRTLRVSETAPDGVYVVCCLNSQFLTEGKLTLMAEMPFWMSSRQVQLLRKGDILNNTDYSFMGTLVERVEPKEPGFYLINGKLELRQDETAGAWRLQQEIPSWERVGSAELTADTVFADPLDGSAHGTLEECLAAHDSVICAVTVEDGRILSVSVEKEY